MNIAVEGAFAGLLLAPAMTLLAILRCSPSARRDFAAVALGLAWQLQARLAITAFAIDLGAMHSAAHPSVWMRVPLEWLLGSTLVSAAVLTLCVRRLPVAAALAVLALGEFSALMLTGWLLRPGSAALAFYLALLAVAITPAYLLVHDTLCGRNLTRRSWLQGICFAGLLGFIITDLMLGASGEGWQALLVRTPAQIILRALPVLMAIVLYALAAREFAVRGGGTPYPFDPPTRLVTTGVYAVMANPMQFSICLFLLGWGWLLGSPVVALASIGALMQYIVFDRLCSGRSTLGESPEWHAYRARTRAWLPRLPDSVLPRTVVTAQPLKPVPRRGPSGIRLFVSLDHWVSDEDASTTPSAQPAAPRRARRYDRCSHPLV